MKIPLPESLFNRVASLTPTALLKETLVQVFSCEFYEIFKNAYFEELLQMVACATLTKNSTIIQSIVDGIYISKIKENNHLLILIAQGFQCSSTGRLITDKPKQEHF